jgi:putative endonuclease
VQDKNRASKKGSGWRIELGRLGESQALDWLKQSGWTIYETNWRSGRYGEVDIIAEDQDRTLVFVEVKTRLLHQIEEGFRNIGFESVNRRKQQKMTILAFTYMAAHRQRGRDCRFDVIVIEYQSAVKPGEKSLARLDDIVPTIRHVQGAFY